MRMQFTATEIKRLKDSYSEIKTINPKGVACKQMENICKRMTGAQLQQIIDAKIPFLSIAAKHQMMED